MRLEIVKESDRRPELFRRYPALEGKLHWLSLGEFPTPVQRLSALGKELGLSELYIKRDDLSSPHYGGNKVRKLEFLLAEAKRRGARTLITFGAAGSNHVVATVIHGTRMGMRTAAILVPQPNTDYVRKNLLLNLAYGAYLVPTRSAPGAIWGLIKSYARWFDSFSLKTPYVIPPGGSSRLGCLGFVEGALELAAQVAEGLLPEPEYVFVAYGSGGTAAGLKVGLELAGLSSRVIPIAVAEKYICNRYLLSRQINRTARFLSSLVPGISLTRVNPREIPVREDYFGGQYARFTPEGSEAVKVIRETEGLVLEGTYTGKALAGALDLIKRNELEKRPCLFWNTYNSVDLGGVVKDQDWRLLPPLLRKYFTQPTQEEEIGHSERWSDDLERICPLT